MSLQKMGGKPSSYHKNTLLQSFRCAFTGLWYALRHERNLRIDLVAGMMAFYLSRYYGFSRAEKGLLILMISLVIAFECMNTAVEAAVNLKTAAYNPLARIAKDVAAGAVLVCAIGCAAVGVLLFWDPDILLLVWADIRTHLLPAALCAVAAICFIFLPGYKKKQ